MLRATCFPEHRIAAVSAKVKEEQASPGFGRGRPGAGWNNT